MSDNARETPWLAIAAGLWWAGAAVLLALGLIFPALGVPGALLVYCAATVIASTLAFGAYGLDKWLAASHEGRRIPERTLHGLDLAGGWAGGLLAQQLFHHKTRKSSFGLVFWATVALHLAVLAWCGWMWAA